MISFPLDIKNITKVLPHWIKYLDVLIVQRMHTQGKYYDCYVSISHITVALQYKVKFDWYYNDVEINDHYLVELLERSKNILDMLHTIENDEVIVVPNNESSNIEEEIENYSTYTSSFVVRLPNECHKLKIIKET